MAAGAAVLFSVEGLAATRNVTACPTPGQTMLSVKAAPIAVLRRLVEAARVSDAAAMWRLLDRRTRERLGPLSRFENGAARALAQRLTALGRFRVVLSEQITPIFAVGALAGEEQAYAASLRLERGSWRVIVRGPVKLRAIRPDPGETVVRRTQLAAEVAANAPILEGGMWLDGLAFATKCGALSDRRFTMWNEAPQPLERGRHVVVAFASTRAEAGALAWTFSVR